MKKFCALLLCAAALTAFAACARRGAGDAPLRFGLMVDANALPLIIARERGYFEEEGARVELIQFNSAQERDSAIQAGQVDGVISDLLAAAFLSAGGWDFRIASLTNERFGVVAAPGSGVARLEDLRGKTIGMSINTIIQYTVDAQLASVGVPMDEYEVVGIPNQLLRLEMLLGGLVDAAAFPEPLLTAAVVQGARLLSTTEEVGVRAGVKLFSQSFLDSRLDDVRAFYRAYYRAAMAINADPDSFRGYLSRIANFPEIAKDAFDFVVYSEPSMIDESDIERALGWLRRKNLLQARVSPADLIDGRAIEQWSN